MRVLLLLLLQGAPAPGTSFGVEFQPPSGWLPVEAPPLRAFAPPLPGGQLLLLTVWPAERLASPGEFAAWFARRLTGPGETVLQQNGPDRLSANGLEALTATQRVRIPQGGQIVRVVYGISAGDRVALAMLTSNQDQLITRYAEPARTFFESVRFPAPGPPMVDSSVRGPPVAGADRTRIPGAGFEGDQPRGLFYRLQVGLGTTQMETRVLIFLPQRVLRVYPFGDGNTIDLARCNPDTCGSYHLDGDGLSVRWDNGDTRRLSFARAGPGFTLDGDAYRPARAVGAAEAVGDWMKPGDAGNPFTTALRLRGDGSFEWGGGSTATTLRGRYELRGLTLVLHFTDGSTKEYTLFAAGRTLPLGLISFDGDVYSRR
ncbi:MAG: hypothetical protein ACREMF_10915 [Gemmatimonadales bacterium]